MRCRCGRLVKGGAEVVGGSLDVVLGGGFGAGSFNVVGESGLGGIEGGNRVCGFIAGLVRKGFGNIVVGLDVSGGVDGPVSFLSGGERFDWIVNKSLRRRRSETLNQYFVVVKREWPEVDGLDGFDWVDLDLGKAGIVVFEGVGRVVVEKGTDGRGLHSEGVWV